MIDSSKNLDSAEVCLKIKLHKLNNKSVMIIGGNGLIGLNISKTLSYFNSKKKSNNIKIISISLSKSIEKLKDIKYYTGDITEESFLKKIPKADYIIFAAGYGQPKKFIKDKDKTILINTYSLIKISKKLQKNGKLIYMSSSEIYSENPKKIYNEKDIGWTTPNHVRSSYIESKRCGEAVINSLLTKKINAVSLRISLAYGPGVKTSDSRVINELIMKALKGDIYLKDSGEAIRTYGYISDIVQMILQIVISNKSNVYNVAGSSTLKIKTLAKKIAKILNRKVIINKKKEYLKDAPKRVKVSMKLYEKEFGKMNLVNINKGLLRTIDWYKSII